MEMGPDSLSKKLEETKQTVYRQCSTVTLVSCTNFFFGEEGGGGFNYKMVFDNNPIKMLFVFSA